MRLEHPSSRTINEVIARTAAGTTCGMRFPGQANSNLRKQAVNLVPFPRPHFFMDSISPLTPLQNRTRKYNVSEIMTELYDKSSFMTSADPCQGRFMTASAIFRGNVSTSEAEEECHKIMSKNSSYFFEWIPSNIGCSVCNMGLPG